MLTQARLEFFAFSFFKTFLQLFRHVLLALSCFVLVACATYDPYTGDKETSKTAKGAAIGALAGAVIGAATAGKGNKDRAILTGAASGAAVGGGIGYYMDAQEAKLRKQLRGSGVQVRREGDEIFLVMPGNITFDTAQFAIKSSFYDVLNSVVLVVKEYDKTIIEVSGHTDSVGNANYNQTLSEQRAGSVSNYLIQQGVVQSRVSAIGYGFRYPVASNDNAQGREQNRRVELKLVAIPQN